MAGYTYGPFSIQVENVNVEKGKAAYSIQVRVRNNSPTEIHFDEGSKEYEYLEDLLTPNLNDEEYAARNLVSLIFPHICSDAHDFRLLVTEIYEAGRKEGTETIRREFRQMMGL